MFKKFKSFCGEVAAKVRNTFKSVEGGNLSAHMLSPTCKYLSMYSLVS